MATALAPMSEAPAVDLFARALVAAQRMRMGTSERLRLESLRLTVSAKGVPSDDPRIAHWLAAALCSSREERAQFLQLCAVPGAQLQLVERVVVENETVASVAERAVAPEQATPASPRWRRPIVVAAFVVLAIALAVIAAMVWPSSPDTSPDLGNVDLNAIAATPTPQDTPSAEPVPMTTQYQPVWIGILLLLVPLLAAAWYISLELRRRRALRRDFAPAPQRSLTLAFAAGPEGLLGDPVARRALRRLRRHRPVPSRALDVPATIEATIATGGRPDLRFSTRPESPEYLVLAERESPRDHLAWLGGLLSARMREEQIATAHFEFLGDPRRLHRIERGSLREVESLPGVIALHDRANMLLVVESYDCAARDAASDWIDTLALTASPALLDPRPRGDWDADELWLARRGISAFAMSGAGLSAYADHLSGVPVATTAGNRQSVDLPTGFAKHREMLVADTPPDPVIVSGLVDDLEDWLDRAGFEWLCAVALFPYVDPGLTIHLGAVLTDKAGKPLLEEARFLRLARLPWMREGRMPDWLRTMLVRRLRPDRLTAATAAIQAFLVPQADGATRIDLGLGEDAGWRAKLLDWLRRRPSSVLADRLLIDALADRPPDQLGLEVAKPLRDRLAPLWADHAIRAVLLAVAAMIGIAVAVPPFTAVELPDVPLVPPDDGKSSVVEPPAEPAPTAAENAVDAAPGDVGGGPAAASAAAPPSPSPAAATQMTVHIQYAAASDRDAALKLQSVLAASGIAAPGIEQRAGASPNRAEVRYKQGQEDRAASLASLAGRTLGFSQALPTARLNAKTAQSLGDDTLEVWLPRDGLSGSTGGGWGEATKASPPTTNGPMQRQVLSKAPPSKVPSSKNSTKSGLVQPAPSPPPQQQQQQQQQQQAPSKASPASVETNVLFYRQAFSEDPPEPGALSAVVDQFRSAQKEAMGSGLDPETVNVRIVRDASARQGYDSDIARALVSRGVPAAAIYLGTTPYARAAAGGSDQKAPFRMMHAAATKYGSLATVYVFGPRAEQAPSKKY
jgi:hypothetical protein